MKLYCITLILFDVVAAFSARGIFYDRRMESLLMANDRTEEQEPRTNLQARVNELADRRAKIQLEINAEEEKAKELRIKFENLKKEIELEAKEKAEEEVAKAAAEAKKKAEEEALAKKKAEEEALKKKKIEEVAIMKKKAEEEALMKKKAEEEALVKKKIEEEAAAKKKAEEEALMKKKAEEEALMKKKAEEEAAVKKKAEEEALMKKKAEEEALMKKKAEEDSTAKKKAEEEALMKQKAEKEATAKKKAEEETPIRTTNETVKTNGDTSKTVAPSVPAVIPNELNQHLNLPKAFNIDTLKSLSSSNQVRVVTGLATSFSALVLLRSFLMERTETPDENSKSAIAQAMERAGLGERPQKKSKPYTKVPTTQKVDITAADQIAAKPKAGAGNAKAKTPTKAKPPTKPKTKLATKDGSQSNTKASVEATEKSKQQSVSNVEISPKPESKRVPSQNSDTKTTESTPAKKQIDITQGLDPEKEKKTLSDKIAESKPAPQTKDQLSPSSNNATSISSDNDNGQISPNTSPSKPSRPFLGGSSSYLDSL